MIKCRSPRSLVWGIRNLLWFLVRSEHAVSGRNVCNNVSQRHAPQKDPTATSNMFRKFGELWTSEMFADIGLQYREEGLAVASIARDDPSTLPGDDPFPRAH